MFLVYTYNFEIHEVRLVIYVLSICCHVMCKNAVSRRNQVISPLESFDFPTPGNTTYMHLYFY